jgi:hypothetical protein
MKLRARICLLASEGTNVPDEQEYKVKMQVTGIVTIYIYAEDEDDAKDAAEFEDFDGTDVDWSDDREILEVDPVN